MMSSRRASTKASRRLSESCTLSTVMENAACFSSPGNSHEFGGTSRCTNRRYSKPFGRQRIRQGSELNLLRRSSSVSVDKLATIADKQAMFSQKKVEIFDSHAVDFTRLRQLHSQNNEDKFSSPLQMRQRLGNARKLPRRGSFTESLHDQKIYPNRRRNGISVATRDECERRQSNTGTADFSDTPSMDELRRTSLASTVSTVMRRRKSSLIFKTQQKQATHDTLKSYTKFRREELKKESRLKKVQNEARLRPNYEDTSFFAGRVSDRRKNNKTVRKSRRKYIMPMIFNTEVSSDDESQKNEESDHSQEEDSEGNIYDKLPKLSSKRTEANVWKDPRFQNLLSTLVPLEDSKIWSTSNFKQGRRRWWRFNTL